MTKKMPQLKPIASKKLPINFLDRLADIEGQVTISDDELVSSITAYKNLIRYFEGRGDCGIIVSDLRRKLDQYESCMNSRNGN